MANNNFVKGECRNCAGHLEFPAEAAGQTVPCPHCGQPTELKAGVAASPKGNLPKRIRLIGLAAALVILAGVAALTAVHFLRTPAPPAEAPDTNKPVAVTPPPVETAPVVPAVPQLKPGEVITNQFDVSPVKLDKTPGSSLVYVTGTVRNLTNRQRFGVKVEFTLFDTNDLAIGHATDYQPVLDPKAGWHFKAMVMASKTVAARFSAIKEDQ